MIKPIPREAPVITTTLLSSHRFGEQANPFRFRSTNRKMRLLIPIFINNFSLLFQIFNHRILAFICLLKYRMILKLPSSKCQENEDTALLERMNEVCLNLNFGIKPSFLDRFSVSIKHNLSYCSSFFHRKEILSQLTRQRISGFSDGNKSQLLALACMW